MTNQFTVRGLNTEEYAAIKKAAKEEIPFTVCIRICKRQYAFGAIDIRPKTPRGSADPFYKWTEEEFKIVLDFAIRNKLLYATTLITEVKAGTHHDQFGMQFMFWKGGFTFLQFVEGYEPPQAVVAEEVAVSEVVEEEAKMTDTEACEMAETVSVTLDNKNTNDAHTTEILSNNARHYGFVPDTIDTLIEKMNTYALDPTFESYGNFITEFNPGRWTESNEKYRGLTCFFGNFHTYSNVFRVYTNDPEVIDKLTHAIRSNQLTEDYKAAKIDIEDRNNEWNTIHMESMNRGMNRVI